MNSKIASNPAPTQTMSKKEMRTWFWLWLSLFALPAVVQALPNDAVVQGVRQSLDAAAGGTVEMRQSEVTGLATFMAAPRGKPIPTFASPTDKADDRSRQFLNLYGKAFGLSLPEQLQVQKVQGPDKVGMEHVRYRQLHRGVPITGGEIIVHMKGTNVTAVNAKTLPDLDAVNTTPTITAQQAKVAAQQVLVKHLNVSDAQLSTPRLEVFNRGLLEGRSYPTRLAWFIEATKINVREFIWIDAQRGGVLLHFSQLTDAKSRSIYTANNTSVLPGTLKRTEGELSTGDTDADKVYDYAGDTYDYFFNQHGRDSFDGKGATLKSSVHYCPGSWDCPYSNAFWNGIQMVYGNGWSLADDVVAHELTHAVTEKTANLIYYMQSGALNESFSDIFGETVDLTNTGGTDTADKRWQIGEDIPGIGAFRNMMYPTLYGNPGKVSDTQFICNKPATDYGGVHTNSGIPNHAYALMVDGGTYNGKTINGIGLSKVGKIEYRTLSQYLVSIADFQAYYSVTQQACNDLIGLYGITSADCAEVKNALDAVEMNSNRCASSGVPSFCQTGQIVNNIFFDNLENTNSGRWANTVASGGNHWNLCYGIPDIYCNGGFPASGNYMFWGGNLNIVGDSSVAMTTNITIPSGTVRLQFSHAYNFENFNGVKYDGGVVEYSTNDGTVWNDAGSLIISGAKYGGTIASGRSNPLAGKLAFVADSVGYTASQLNLASLTGQNVRFRFRMGTDNQVGANGWWVDDVRIYSCTTPQPDYMVTSVTTDPISPLGGSSFNANVTLKNQGTANGNLGTVQVWSNQTTNQACNSVGDKSVTVGTLAAGASTTVTISGIPTGVTGSKTLLAFIDSNCQTAEIDENNNQFKLNYMVQSPMANIAVTANPYGTVSSSPTGINCGTVCSYDFALNATVTLTAAPNAGYSFGGWGGACASYGTSPCQLTMNAAKTVSTTFNPTSTTSYPLTVTKTGSGSVTSTPIGITCGTTCSANFNSGTQVTLKATPTTGYAFGNWSGCSSVTAAGDCLVTMSAANSVSASFNPILTLTVGTNGTVSSNPTGIACNPTCSKDYPLGTAVTLTATPNESFVLEAWGGVCSGNGACVVTMNAPTTVSATFVIAPWLTATVDYIMDDSNDPPAWMPAVNEYIMDDSQTLAPWMPVVINYIMMN